MPQLEGQPGSRGMNPPGGISTINLSNWSDPTPPSASRRNIQANDDSFSQSGNENTGSCPSAGLSESNNSRGIARMHQQAPGGNSTISFGGRSTAAESEALLKKRPGYDEKRKEMYGSGIFNEASGSCDGDAGYGGNFVDKAPAAGENHLQPRGRIQSDAKHKELFGSTPIDYQGRIGGLYGYQEPRCRPTSDAKAKELNGNNIFGYSNQDYHPPSRGSYQESEDNRFPPRQSSNNHISPSGASPRSYAGEDHSEYTPASNFDGAKQRELSGSNENLNDLTGRLSFSNAKAREMAGDNIFGPQPSPLDAAKTPAPSREPAGKRSQLMLNNMHDENPDPFGHKKHEMKSAELSGNNIFLGGSNAGDETPQHHQRSVAKVREMSGSDIFSNDQPKARNTVGGIRKPPGGGSTIRLA